MAVQIIYEGWRKSIPEIGLSTSTLNGNFSSVVLYKRNHYESWLLLNKALILKMPALYLFANARTAKKVFASLQLKTP